MATQLTYCGGTLREAEANGDVLQLTFCNGPTFGPGFERAFLDVSLKGCSELPRIAEELALLRGEEVDGLAIETDQGTSRLLIDFCWANGGEAYALTAQDIQFSYRAYGIADYQEHIGIIERRWSDDRHHLHALRMRMQHLGAELAEEIVRLDRKSAFFAGRDDTKAVAIGARAKALREVARRLDANIALSGSVPRGDQ